jgi:hypothetical protein
LHPIPPPAPVYSGADEDAHASRFDPADDRAFAESDRRVFTNPDDVDARIARGYAHARRGSRALSDADYRHAWQLAPYRTRIGWSQGWALFSLGDPACAVHAWQRAGALQGGDAFWLPYTLVIVALEILFAVAVYAVRGWNWPLAIVHIPLTLAGTIPAVWLFVTHQVWNDAFIQKLGWSAETMVLADNITAGVFALAALWSLADGIIRAAKAKRRVTTA